MIILSLLVILQTFIYFRVLPKKLHKVACFLLFNYNATAYVNDHFVFTPASPAFTLNTLVHNILDSIFLFLSIKPDQLTLIN